LIRNTKLGGTDWSTPSARIKPSDLNDTFDEVADRTNKKLGKIYDNFEQEQLDVTDTSSSVSYSQQHENHIIKNVGSSIAYFNLDATATTDSFKINPSETVLFNGNVTAVHAICDTGETTELRIIGQS
jgi:hypothetical protein